MSEIKSLKIYTEIFRMFQGKLAAAPANVEVVLEKAVGWLMRRMRIDTVSLYWWDESSNTLNLEYQLHEGSLLEGEEVIVLEESSVLQSLVLDGEPVVVSERKPWVAFVPLHNGAGLIGALRIERQHPLPRGSVLKDLPSFILPTGKTRNFPLLEDIASLLSVKLQQLFKEKDHKKKAQYLQAGVEVMRAVSERPRLKDMLEAVSESIVYNLGFDRIRFYLIDSEHFQLRGLSGFQIPGRTLDLDGETYDLRPGVNSLVDATLSEHNGDEATAVGRILAYVPIIGKGQVIGCMAIDNLLSQQEIRPAQLEAMRSLVTPIGMAILNARLFEDIEQQAITDGLTKLYVFRYFQQRLKEEIDRADRYSYSIALVMMDLDNFKRLNDTYGHLVGDKVLEFLSQTIRANIRRIDLAARYGGDEFVLVLPETTEQEAWLMAARLINALKQTTLRAPNGDTLPVVVTMGIAMYPGDMRSARDLIEAADKALYWAKKHSRGDICFYKAIGKDTANSAS